MRKAMYYFLNSSYTCGRYANFKNVEANLTYVEAEAICQWNKTWSKDPLDKCSWTHCPIIHQPPLEHNFVFTPENGSSLTLLQSKSCQMQMNI